VTPAAAATRAAAATATGSGSLVLTLLILLACSGSRSEVNAPPAHADVAVLKVAPGDDLIAVTAAGAKLEPPVTASRIPEGAWYCDMGKVHYARSEKGDGICPLCKMQLTQKGPAPAPEPTPAAAPAPTTQ